jgi:hypothetical protein
MGCRSDKPGGSSPAHAASNGAAIGASHESVNTQREPDQRQGHDVDPVADLEQIGRHSDTDLVTGRATSRSAINHDACTDGDGGNRRL